MIYPYKINSIETLYKLSDLASKEPFSIYVSTPYGQLDVRSLPGLFTVLGEDINLVVPDHAQAKDFLKFIAKLKAL